MPHGGYFFNMGGVVSGFFFRRDGWVSGWRVKLLRDSRGHLFWDVAALTYNIFSAMYCKTKRESGNVIKKKGSKKTQIFPPWRIRLATYEKGRKE
jgi:hypothetical protein